MLAYVPLLAAVGLCLALVLPLADRRADLFEIGRAHV